MAKRESVIQPWAIVRNRSLLADVGLLLAVVALLYGVARIGSGFFVSFHPPYDMPRVSLDPKYLPYYAARSTLRMFIALACSLGFTLTYGYLAAKNRHAEKIMMPLLDILQSIPVLGFLSVTVTGFMALFPGSLLGLECACIFAIFTGQAWNMTFSFYHSLVSLPKELDEAARIFRLTPFRRFVTFEVPHSMIGLVWNGMMSFGGGWFFVSASEAITVLNQRYTLPGIGSYVAEAVRTQDLGVMGWAILAMVLVILLVDQLFWRPVVAWSEKYRMDVGASSLQSQSWVLNILRASRVPKALGNVTMAALSMLPKRGPSKFELGWLDPRMPRLFRRKRRIHVNGDLIFGVVVGLAVAVSALVCAQVVYREVPLLEVARAFELGFFTLLRVLCLVAVASVIWTPVGVLIGFNPKLAQVLQPVALLLASFPANFLFPAMTAFFVGTHMSLNFGSILLMALGTQWYILFNAIAGAVAVPLELRDMISTMRLPRRELWTKMILPAIFPFWITGALTASGGAWNASIISEIVPWGKSTIVADGLGAYITSATTTGDAPRIVLGIGVMCIFVVTFNRLVWRRLYALALARYSLG